MTVLHQPSWAGGVAGWLVERTCWSKGKGEQQEEALRGDQQLWSLLGTFSFNIPSVKGCNLTACFSQWHVPNHTAQRIRQPPKHQRGAQRWFQAALTISTSLCVPPGVLNVVMAGRHRRTRQQKRGELRVLCYHPLRIPESGRKTQYGEGENITFSSCFALSFKVLASHLCHQDCSPQLHRLDK